MDTPFAHRYAAALLIALAVTCSARAQEAQQSTFGQPGFGIGNFETLPSYLDLNAGVVYTDNALLAPADRMSTGIGSAGFDIDYNHAGGMLDVAAQGDVDWLQYFDHAYSGNAYGNFNGAAVWGHPTDMLQWLVQETFGDGMVNPLAAPTPSELQSINYFTTGPYLNFNFTTTERLSFYGLYSDTSYQKSPYDFQTYDGGGIFAHQLSNFSSLSLQVDSAQNHFNDFGAVSSYDMRTAQITYTAQFVRTRASASAGYTLEDFEGPQNGAPLVALDLSRRVSASSTLSVHAHDQYLTYGEAIRSQLGAPTGASLAAPAFAGSTTAAPLKDRLVSLGWNFRRGRTSLSIAGSVEQQLYAQSTLFDSHIDTISAGVQRQLRPTVSLSLQAYQNRETYRSLEGKLTATVVNLSLTKQFRKVGLSIFAQRTHQISSSPEAASLGLGVGSYDEDRVGLNITYDLVGSRVPEGMQGTPIGSEATGDAP